MNSQRQRQKKSISVATESDTETEQIVLPTFNHPERYCLIWFFVGAPQQRRSREIESLRSVLNEIFVVYNLKSVEEAIQRLCDRKLFFIFDGDVDYQVLVRIHRRYQVLAIYTLQPERKSQLDEPKRSLPKVRVSTANFRTLFNMLRDDLHAYEKIDGLNISENLPETMFRYFRVLSALLPSLSEKNHRDASNSAKDDLLRILEPKFVGMETLFHNFREEISPSTAISWYTQETPIYRLVNQAFDFADPHLLMALRYFIGCLLVQLKQEHQESKTIPGRFKTLDQKSGVFHVYRGQLLSNSDLERLKTLVGSVIFLTSFTLTTQERNVALGFLRRAFRSDRETFVLFKIAIDQRSEETPVYADVAHLSYNADQEEVLLMFGAALLVKEIKDDPYNGFPTVEFALHPNPQLNEAMNINHKKSQTESRFRRAVSKHPQSQSRAETVRHSTHRKH